MTRSKKCTVWTQGQKDPLWQRHENFKHISALLCTWKVIASEYGNEQPKSQWYDTLENIAEQRFWPYNTHVTIWKYVRNTFCTTRWKTSTGDTNSWPHNSRGPIRMNPFTAKNSPFMYPTHPSWIHQQLASTIRKCTRIKFRTTDDKAGKLSKRYEFPSAWWLGFDENEYIYFK